MRSRIRGFLWLFALALALALVWPRVRIVLVVNVGWLQLLAIFAVLALIIYLLLDYIVDRLGK